MKKILLLFIIVAFFIIDKTAYAASGSPGSQGVILYVEGVNGVVGWAKGINNDNIQVDLYVSKKGDDASKSICSKGGIEANRSLTDTNKRFGTKNGKLFFYNDACLKNLPDGTYDVYLALGPNLFAPGPFTFTVTSFGTNNANRMWAHYLGVLINRVSNDYDNYPTVMRDGDSFKMWYTSGNLTGHPGDNIFYAESEDGIQWNLIHGPLEGGAVLTQTLNDCYCRDGGSGGVCPSGQAFAPDDMHVADPTVIKVNNTYYMYYTGASKRYSCFGSGNNVYVATSSDGIYWQKSLDQNMLPVPVISMQNPCTSIATCGPWAAGYPSWYGAGMPSVIYRDFDGSGKKFINFYTDFSVNGMAWGMAISSDGINFNYKEHSINGDATWDVKYSNYLKSYIAINAQPTSQNTPGLIMLALSPSAHANTWKNISKFKIAPNFLGDTTLRDTAFTMDQFTSDRNHWVISNGAFLGDTEGIIPDRNTVFYMGGGLGMQPLENTWDIIGIDVWFSNTSSAYPAGDLDHSGKVDIFDYNTMLQNFGKTNCGNIADIDGNCRVDIFDYGSLVGNFGKTN